MKDIYSEATIKIVPEMTLAQHAVVSNSPETDAVSHILCWADKNGLSEETGSQPRILGWDFPFVSDEQREVFGMRGYVAACVLSKEFKADFEGADIVKVEENRYVSVTITEPREDSLRKIPNGYKKAFEFIESNGLVQSWDGRVSFEEEYSVDGVRYMDVYVPIE